MMTAELDAWPRTSYEIERLTLGNGLRVVLNPDRSVAVTGIAVLYDVGTRSEPAGHSGFAHLFEHLMFQGSVNVPKLEHARYVQGAGGRFNGSTHLDYTEYSDTVPAHALERTLFLEADRMRGLRLTGTNLRNQVDVVKEEIRAKVLNRPYGGFPAQRLPRVMFATFANGHDGYGSFADLESAGVPDAVAFYDRYYSPANAVLCVAGDFHPDQAIRLVERHFAAVPARPAPARPSFREPDLTAERRDSYVDPLAPLPAVACAWRVPDPIADFERFLPYVILAAVLADGEASRLVERLVFRDRSATLLRGFVGFMAEPFQVRDPTALLVTAYLPPGGDAGHVLAAMSEEIERLAEGGVTGEELARCRARTVTDLLRETHPIPDRTLGLGALELLRGRAELINDLPGLVASVPDDDIRAAAGTLVPARRASVEVVPGAGGRNAR